MQLVITSYSIHYTKLYENEHDDLAQAQILEVRLIGIVGASPDDLLQHAQHIRRGQDRTGDGCQRKDNIMFKRPGKNKELTDEGVGSGKAKGRERKESYNFV